MSTLTKIFGCRIFELCTHEIVSNCEKKITSCSVTDEVVIFSCCKSLYLAEVSPFLLIFRFDPLNSFL